MYWRILRIFVNELGETLSIAGKAGYRFFTDIESFKIYVTEDVLGELKE